MAKKKKIEEKVEENKNLEQPQEVAEEKVELSVEEIRAKRKEDAEAKEASKKEELDQREEFRKFFAKKKEKLKLDSSMEHILWLHMESSGFAEKEKFEDGLKHFGIHQ